MTAETPEPPKKANLRSGLEIASLVSQVIATVAVIISLVYVGVQLAQTNSQLRRGESNATLTQFQAIRLAIIENRDVADLLARGLYARQKLDYADAIRLDTFLSEFTFSSFHIWDRARSGLLDADEFTRSSAPVLARLLCTEQGSAWWRRSRGQFVDAFATETDRAIGDLPRDQCPDFVPPDPAPVHG